SGDGPADLGGEFGRHSLVSVDLDDPVAAAGVDPGVPARPFPLPRALNEPIGRAPRDLTGSVAAAVEHNDDFVGKTERGEAVGAPAAAAICMSPVSLPINIAQRRNTATAVSRSTLPTRSICRWRGIAASNGSACLRSCEAAITATRAPASGPSTAVKRCASSAK